ncbi:hypothetical protein ACFHWW_21035 [Ensifer sp. P24N7]|uniref:hypothetical protein n=1 Tax=unclassified Sinorhizobium TaxID=2613772 RepID=UPI0035F2BF58
MSEVVPQGELMARARAIAVSLYRGTATAKANLKAAVSMPLEKAIEYERDLQTICFATEDGAEAPDLRKSAARFSGADKRPGGMGRQDRDRKHAVHRMLRRLRPEWRPNKSAPPANVANCCASEIMIRLG